MECAWFIEVRGMHPQTGEEISEWGCSMSMLPVLLIENGRQTSHAGAAIESFRNEMVKALFIIESSAILKRNNAVSPKNR